MSCIRRKSEGSGYLNVPAVSVLVSVLWNSGASTWRVTHASPSLTQFSMRPSLTCGPSLQPNWSAAPTMSPKFSSTVAYLSRDDDPMLVFEVLPQGVSCHFPRLPDLLGEPVIAVLLRLGVHLVDLGEEIVAGARDLTHPGHDPPVALLG